MDERKGRSVAQAEGVPVIGLVGVVILAKRRALIPTARALLEQIEITAGMYLSPALKDAALRTVDE